jgi:hypothetical protein
MRNPQDLTNLDPNDGHSLLDAIRELAVALQEAQSQLLVLESEVDDLSESVRTLEDKPTT